MTVLRVLAVALFALAAMPSAKAATETIAVIGTGNVGGALGPRWASLGHKVIYGSRHPDDAKVQALVKSSPGATAVSPKAAAEKADIILLAVPEKAVFDAIAGLGDLKGKIIIDATNVLAVKDGKVVEPEGKESCVERLQALAPTASVVKGFNTTTSYVMTNPSIVGASVTIPLAGNDTAAKARVAALATALGFQTVDLGGLEAGLFVEQLGRFYVGYSFRHKPERLEFGFHTWGR